MVKMPRLIIASGYFNPLHRGHIDYLRNSKELGGDLLVIINNDAQVKLKGTKEFQDEQERLYIIKNLSCVDFVVLSIDIDSSVSKTIEEIDSLIGNDYHSMVFANGGDALSINCPEKDVCDRLGIRMVDGLGEKVQSSSKLKNKL